VPFSYEIDSDRRLVIVRPESPPSTGDWEDMLDRVAADPRFQQGFNLLSDRQHLHSEPDAIYVHTTIDAVAARAVFRSTRFAVLTSHLATYGMARMAEALAENRGIEWRVFMDRAEAMRWLSDAETRAPS
jgi:hypothetical protein